jgi:phosphate transport system substrate-binding protein
VPLGCPDGQQVAATQNVSSAGSPTSTTTRPIRIVASPDIAPLLKNTSSDSRYSGSASFEVDSAGAALPTLCAAEEADQPDIVITSRRARKEEFKLCKRPHYNGEVLEGTLGHVAMVVTRAKSGTPMQLSTETLRLALLKRVPAPENSSQVIDNPYTHWNQIDPSLEDRRIEVLGPARETPEFLVFASIVLAPACENNASLDEDLCQSVREDGIYTAARFDANFVPQRLWSDPNVVAIMDYRFYVANSADLLGSLLPGAAPTRESIIDGKYIGARTLHAYVNSGRYRNFAKVRSSINDYLRLPANFHPGAIIPSDVNLDWKRPYEAGPKLTEVKLD